MLWSKAFIAIWAELLFGFACGRVLIPYFRKLKTGKLELYIGDRFKKDGSEPLFGGVVIALTLVFGAMIGMLSFRADADIGDSGLAKYAAVIVMSLLLMLVGVAEDHLRDLRKSNVGLKTVTKLVLEFVICLGFLVFLRACGADDTAVLLPFRLGYMDFRLFYYPLTALGMTAVINAVKVHDCFGGDVQSGIDGLCPLSAVIYSLFFAVYGNVIGDSYLNMLGYVTAAACMAYLIWGISPSKMYCGQSGAYLLGGLVSCMAVVSKLHLAVFMAGLSFLVDGVCCLVQYVVFRKSKRLLLKGNSLHAHFKAKGYSDYKIMMIFSCISVVGGAAGIAFAVYSTKIM